MGSTRMEKAQQRGAAVFQKIHGCDLSGECIGRKWMNLKYKYDSNTVRPTRVLSEIRV